jgi:flagellar biosynthesis/type III secretory pathway protein FliH
MFQGVQAYHGNVVGTPQELEAVAPQPDALYAHGEDAGHEADTASQILRYAREEAASIVEMARSTANDEKERILAEAHAEADLITVNKAIDTVARLNLELWSSRIAMADVLEKALERIIGDIGQDNAAFLAVENALKDYRGEKSLKILASGHTADRLQLVAIGKKKDLTRMGIELVCDPCIEPGRCLLDTGAERVEIGLDAQLAALKKLIAGEREQAVREVRRGGDLHA